MSWAPPSPACPKGQTSAVRHHRGEQGHGLDGLRAEVPDPCECRMGTHCSQAGPQGDQTRSPAAPGSCMRAAAWGSCSRYWVQEPAFLSILCENHVEQSPSLEGKQGLWAPQGRKRLLRGSFEALVPGCDRLRVHRLFEGVGQPSPMRPLVLGLPPSQTSVKIRLVSRNKQELT